VSIVERRTTFCEGTPVELFEYVEISRVAPLGVDRSRANYAGLRDQGDTT
jgi:hypothetical protein